MMQPRSWLFVPADSEKKIAKALDSAADAIIFDLEDSVAPAEKARASAASSEAMARTTATVEDSAIGVGAAVEDFLGQVA